MNTIDAGMSLAPSDDLSREVYGVLGIPVDLINMPTALHEIESAANRKAPFLLSTPNLNFLVASQFDPEFRKSLLISDLCPADGMPIVWLARMLGVPIKERVAGSDIFEALKSTHYNIRRLSVFLFGGPEDIADAACRKLNAEEGGLTCVGSYYPGFATIDEMSVETIIEMINSSNADMLAIALGAKKGQAWLLRNHSHLRIPIRVHLGATINFQAGMINRAPERMRKWGIEWLWRIKEEPQLWKRYWNDGLALLKLVLTRVLPLLVADQWNRLVSKRNGQDLIIERSDSHNSVVIRITGMATAGHINEAISCFRSVIAANLDVAINFDETRVIDSRFLGLLLMLNKLLTKRQLRLTFASVPPRIRRIFELNGFGFLLREI